MFVVNMDESLEAHMHYVSDSDIILKNVCEKKNLEVLFTRNGGNKRKVVQVKYKDIVLWNHMDYFQSLVKDIFLPQGYPNSVSSDYLEYQIWDTCQAFCSSISGTLSISAVMQGVGVGSTAATPVAAAITWIMKDGTGMVGSILFAWSKGSRLDSDCKKWRLFADVLNDAAMCLELYIPYLLEYSMLLLCISTAMKALVGVAGSATRAALTCHQAIQGNMADVSAKDGSQEIFVNLCAYVFGIFLLKNVTGTNTIWIVMCTFIVLHLYSNYKAVSCLKINVYNAERFRLSLRSFLATSDVPTVKHVNRNESVILGRGISDVGIFGFSINLGVSLENAILYQSLTPDDLSFLVVLFQSKNYLILPNLKTGEILVSFRKNFAETDVLKAYFHAVLTAAAIGLSAKKNLPFIRRRRSNSSASRLERVITLYNTTKKTDVHKSKSLPVQAMLSSEEVLEREFALFCKLSVEQNWNLEKNLILVGDWTADWKYVEEKRPSTVEFQLSQKRGSYSVSGPMKEKNTPPPQHNRNHSVQHAQPPIKVNPRQYVNYNPGLKI